MDEETQELVADLHIKIQARDEIIADQAHELRDLRHQLQAAKGQIAALHREAGNYPADVTDVMSG